MPPRDLANLEKQEWKQLLDRIADGKCTPFLGAGVNSGLLPVGNTVSRVWAKECDYPLANCDALDQVAQFISIQRGDRLGPKEDFVKLLHSELARVEESRLKNFLVAPDQPLGVLASLPLPVYITTNYDDLLMRALHAQGKAPRRELCQWWNQSAKKKKFKSVFDSADGFVPNKNIPVVFHMHGHEDIPESLVLTEDDYLDFLVNTSRKRVLPSRIEEALTDATLLFVGYRLADINFRVIFRGLVGSLDQSLQRMSVSVQLPPDVPGQNSARVQSYLGDYLLKLNVHVFWGTAEEFARQLGDRWRQYSGAS